MEPSTATPIISIRGLRTQFGQQVIHDNLDLDVRRGEVLGVVGGSGTGKSVLLRTIIGLIRPRAGKIIVLDQDTSELNDAGWAKLQERWGVLFQSGALFSSLTVAQNIQVPMKEHTELPPKLQSELTALKIELVGLAPESGAKFPSEISGGMKKRAGLARVAGARSGDPVPRRADRRSRPHRRFRLRSTDSQPAAKPWTNCVHGHPRSRQPWRDLRPYCRARG